ncbi:MAG: glycoside hydrolase family 43 protein [Sphingomicrobium sp.]
MNFTLVPRHEGDGFRIDVAADGQTHSYAIPTATHQDFTAFFRALSNDFGTRPPSADSSPRNRSPAPIAWRPMLTHNVHPQILVGYGDPAVLKTDDGWWLTATSNDAPDAFPILHSTDLEQWEPKGFIFPAGSAPLWAETGPGAADFWAPEIARVGEEYWTVFTARQINQSLAIGLARASSPLGPWIDNGQPLVVGGPIDTTGLGFDPAQPTIICGVIDSHIFLDDNGDRYLLWKDDTNGIWPRPLAMLLRKHPELIERLFANQADRRTAAFAAALVPFANSQRPITRFFAMQPLIEAALDNWEQVRETLTEFGLAATTIVGAMTTPLRGQRLAADGRSLVGENRIVLTNDQEWEGHLIEGPFVTRQDKRYWLFYAGNDFSTPSYGIGVAVADHPLGPYVKQGQPLLGSTPEWTAPGHASVAPGVNGKPQLFFHAFHAGTGGYNAFRALLTVGLKFDRGRVELADLD